MDGLEPVKRYALFAEFIGFIAEFSATDCFIFFFDGLMAASLSGVEAEAEVCCLEEAALVHRWGEPGAAGLPAGGPQLARSLLVQVCTEAVMVILWLFCPRKIWHSCFKVRSLPTLLLQLGRFQMLSCPAALQTLPKS